jgi:hypothetical protein
MQPCVQRLDVSTLEFSGCLRHHFTGPEHPSTRMPVLLQLTLDYAARTNELTLWTNEPIKNP